jgi:hypothetical protein
MLSRRIRSLSRHDLFWWAASFDAAQASYVRVHQVDKKYGSALRRREARSLDHRFVEVQMVTELTIESLRILAKQAGLDLSEEELRRLLPGVNRSKRQAAELRDLIATSDEPATRYGAPRLARK